jgi:hypothetical protein
MNLKDFKRGDTFFMGGNAWVCTDVGSRVVVAVRASDLEGCVTKGPPYECAECVLDEYDLAACFHTRAEDEA